MREFPVDVDKSLCRSCGSCCRFMLFGYKAHHSIQDKVFTPDPGSDTEFIRNNCDYLGLAKDLDIPASIPKEFEDGTHVYRCRLLTEDNLCSIHEKKPYVCREYPWYNDFAPRLFANAPWDYSGCGYEKIHWIMIFGQLLLNRIEQIKEWGDEAYPWRTGGDEVREN